MRVEGCLALIVFLAFFSDSDLFSRIKNEVISTGAGRPLIKTGVCASLKMKMSITSGGNRFVVGGKRLLQSTSALYFSFIKCYAGHFSMASLLRGGGIVLLRRRPFTLKRIAICNVGGSCLHLPCARVSSVPMPLCSFTVVSLRGGLCLANKSESRVGPPVNFDLAKSKKLPSKFICRGCDGGVCICSVVSGA